MKVNCTINYSNCLMARWQKVAGAAASSCGLGYGGEVWCWGDNANLELGPAGQTLANSSIPLRVTGLGMVTDLDGGANTFCAVKSDGTVWCWGSNYVGVAGADLAITMSGTPLQVVGVVNAVSVSVGYNHSCALESGGMVKCWGYNQNGQIGNGTIEPVTGPAEVLLTEAAQMVVVTNSTSCALLTSGGLSCWGSNQYGKLGVGSATLTKSGTPLAVATPGLFTWISSGSSHYCAVKNDATLWCWGYNAHGELGDGTITNQYSPVQTVGVNNAAKFAGGLYHSCYVSIGGAVTCWGYNIRGALGDGTQISTQTPGPPIVGLTAVGLARWTGYHTCAVDVHSDIQCWGRNIEAQLGREDNPGNTLVPALVYPEREVNLCSDNLDNDSDGVADCDDPDCDNLGACTTEDTISRCKDGLDNDGDGLTDCLDPDCSGLNVCGPETTAARCGDGIDNDNNGAADCDDAQCASFCNSLYESFAGDSSEEQFDLSFKFLAIDSDDMGSYGYSQGSNAGYSELVGMGPTTYMLNLGGNEGQEILLPFPFPFYGGSHTALYISSDGYLTFNLLSLDNTPSESEFLSGLPRIAWFWKDWNPATATGTDDITVDIYSNRLVLTMENVPDSVGAAFLNVQIVLKDDGTITMHYLNCGSGKGIVGITPGGSEAANESNFIP